MTAFRSGFRGTQISAACAPAGCWGLGASGHVCGHSRGSGPGAWPADAALSWCHPCTAHLFSAQAGDGNAGPDFRRQLGLPESYVLLPASSAIGSYKNPELVLEALVLPALQRHHLLLTGVAAQTQAQRYREAYPALADRIHVRAVEDSDLRLLYRHALAVVVPSRVEGFGLPVLEALAAEGTVLSTDVPGLREAGSGAVPLLDPEQPRQLAAGWSSWRIRCPGVGWPIACGAAAINAWWACRRTWWVWRCCFGPRTPSTRKSQALRFFLCLASAR